MAQQAQETVHKMFKEGREPPWLSASIRQYHNYRKIILAWALSSKNIFIKK
jgi:hypothetical protein